MGKWDLPILGIGALAVGGYVLLNPDILSGITDIFKGAGGDGGNGGGDGGDIEPVDGDSGGDGGNGGGDGGSSGGGDKPYDCAKACRNCWCKSYSEKCSGGCSRCCGGSRIASKCGGQGVKKCSSGGGGGGGSGSGDPVALMATTEMSRISVS